jgi:hypothetical protein
MEHKIILFYTLIAKPQKILKSSKKNQERITTYFIWKHGAENDNNRDKAINL